MARFGQRPLCKCGHVIDTHYVSVGNSGVALGGCTNARCTCSQYRRRKKKENPSLDPGTERKQ